MSTLSTRILFFLSMAVLIASRAGCGAEDSGHKSVVEEKEPHVLARIGNETITGEDLEAALERVPQRKHEALKDRVLDSLIEDRVFAEEAKKAGVHDDPQVKQSLEKIRNETLARCFVKKHLDKDAEPAEEALKKFYLDHRDRFVVPEGVLIQHIVVKDEQKAEEVLKALKAGEAFEVLAKKKSICRCYNKEGRHKWLFKGEMAPELEKVAFNLDKGVLSDLIKTGQRYEVMQVLDRQPQREISFEDARPRIRSSLFLKKKRELINRYYEAAKVNTHPAEPGVLATIGDEDITEETLASILAEVPEKEKEKVRRQWIDYFIETRVFSKEARKVHLENDPDVLRELRRKADRVLATVFRKKFIAGKFQVSDNDVAQYYKVHSKDFRIPERVRAKSILVKTREEAEEILKELKQGASFGYLATKKSLYPRASRRVGEIGWFVKGERDPALEKVSFSLQKGQMSGIIKTEAGFEIIKVMDKKGGGTRAFDEVKEAIKMSLMMQRFEEEKERYYKKAGVKVLTTGA